MERHFEQELEKLNRRLIEMGSLVEQQMNKSLTSFINGDKVLALQVLELDDQVDRLDVKIDKICQRIFALTQPIATDLRFIMSALKINNDLERLGDLAVFIAKRIDNFIDYSEILHELGMKEVASDVLKLIKDVESLIQTRRIVFVKDIFESSTKLKIDSRNISAKILEEMVHKTHDVIVVATHLVLVLSQIERIAGLCNNIAESVYFMVEGEIVKHSKGILPE